MKIFEYSSYGITLILICIAIIHWIRNKILPWRDMGFIIDKKTLHDIMAAFIICGVAVSCIFTIDWFWDFILIQEIKTPSDIFFKFILFLFIASFIEEFINRGLLVNGLSVLLKKNWQIIAFAALFFGLGHASGEGVTLLSIFSNAAGGAVYTIAFISSKNIWFPWALHFSWNTFQYIFGYPVSGFEIESVVVLTDIKNTIFNGGIYGPEGGLIGVFFRIVVLVMILLYVKCYRNVNIKTVFR
ncbi:lysostaphin resistance A-like protein [candidate division KSB1 bacterium]